MRHGRGEHSCKKGKDKGKCVLEMEGGIVSCKEGHA